MTPLFYSGCVACLWGGVGGRTLTGWAEVVATTATSLKLEGMGFWRADRIY